MENKAEKKINIKKVISIIIAISIISSIFVISTLAVDKTIQKGTYDYKDNIVNTTVISNTHEYNISGIIYVDDNSYSFNHITIQTNSNNNAVGTIIFTKTEGGLYSIASATHNSIHFIIDSDYNVTEELYNIFMLSFDKRPDPTIYERSDGFVLYSINTVKALINYMITNNVILIVIAIVIVSFAVGALIRLTRKKL